MTTVKPAEYWIKELQLLPHPEGGFYRETYRADEHIAPQHLPARFGGRRSLCTAIYFLLRSQDISCLHRIKSDELWHFHAGSSLSLYTLAAQGVNTYLLGSSPDRGESLQVAIPANTWFGAKVNEANSYVLVSCTVSPGFDFQDFEMGSKNHLIKEFPEQASLIAALTKD
jgi:uncharacterized protein